MQLFKIKEERLERRVESDLRYRLMKALIIYDSVFGNTEQIAKAIGSALGSPENTGIIRVSNVKPEQLTGLNLLIVGSPTRKFRPTPAITRFLKRIPKDGLKGVRVAAFDTRFTMSGIEESRILPFFARLFGYAAEPISDRLQKKGGKLIIPPEGFFVEDVEGPLKEGELERSAEWAKQIRLLEDFA
jgi:flavodoxin